MKKLLHSFLFVSCVFTATVASAQVSKGQILLGGNISFDSYNAQNVPVQSPKSKGTDFQISVVPDVAVGVGKNFLVGAGIGYAYSSNQQKQQISTPDEYKYTTKRNYVVGEVFARVFSALNDRAGIYGELKTTGQFGNSSYKQVQLSEPVEPEAEKKALTEILASVSPGFYYAIGKQKKVLLDITFGGLTYDNWSSKYKNGDQKGDKNKGSELTLTLINTVTCGFRVRL